VVETFHHLYPHITINVREMSQERMEQLLLADEVDVGLAFADVRSADIDSTPLLTETLALVVSRNHPLAAESSIRLQALNTESLVLLSEEFATRGQIDRYFQQNGIRPRVHVEANAISAVIEIVRRTGLSTLLPSAIASTHEDLVAIELDSARLQRIAVLVQRKDAYRSAASQVFIQLAKEVGRQLDGS
jgi:LysR family cyn operon transcriptional activator